MLSKNPIDSYEQLYKRAKKCFSDNLVELGVGGSGCIGRDIDAVVILKKLKFDQIKEFVNDRISVVPLTNLMWRNEDMWPDKLITMLLKGVDFNHKVEVIEIETAKRLTKPLIPEAIYRISRNIIDGKETETGALDLMIQYLAILL